MFIDEKILKIMNINIILLSFLNEFARAGELVFKTSDSFH